MSSATIVSKTTSIQMVEGHPEFPITFHVVLIAPEHWTKGQLLEVLSPWENIADPSLWDWVPAHKHKRGNGSYRLMFMVFGNPYIAFETAKEIRSHGKISVKKDGGLDEFLEFCWVSFKGPHTFSCKMLPHVSESSPYTWNDSDFLSLRNFAEECVDYDWEPNFTWEFSKLGDHLYDYGNFVPGCLAFLPELERRNFQARTDQRLDSETYGHPVILVHDFRNGLGNVVICTSFLGRHIDDVWPKGRPEREKYLEVDSSPRRRSQRNSPESESLDENVLMFERSSRFRMPARTYVKTKAYTVELRALIKFGQNTPFSTCILNFRLLRQKMKDLNEPYTVQNPVGIQDEKDQDDSMNESDTSESRKPNAIPDKTPEAIEPETRYFPLLMRNLARNIPMGVLKALFARWTSVKNGWIFKSEFEYRETERAVLYFTDEKERDDAIKQLQVPYTSAAQNGNTMYWAVNWADIYDFTALRKGPVWKSRAYRQRAEGEEPYTDKEHEEFTESDWHKRYWGRHHDDTVEPGTILALPPLRYQRPEYFVDSGIEPSAFARPVIAVHDQGDGFWSIITCPDGPTYHEYIEQEELRCRFLKFGWPYLSQTAEGGIQLKSISSSCKARKLLEINLPSYVGTVIFTVEINALARYAPDDTPSEWQVANMDYLTQKLRLAGSVFKEGDASRHPAYTGAQVNSTVTPRVGPALTWGICCPNDYWDSVEGTKDAVEPETTLGHAVDQPLKVENMTPVTFGRGWARPRE